MTTPQVTVSPACRFGQPSMRGTPTEAIADYYWIGEDVEDEYTLTRHELLVVLWFEATHGQPRFRKRWKAWAAQVHQTLWDTRTLDPMTVPLPSTTLN
ncbi:hypothetical protein [Paractinoplanes toevensis]|uniref:Uncharacterized protein n=1 Tax=Paractinoplanes toevensis TaxID=571911 RepID=A0A919VY93_9ACTN|nr:hypothetical protein [Actinoplanes toevensis]GIM88742.1 hypothetical protein Ato02nite_005350 [Actinoplanes toevensis]